MQTENAGQLTQVIGALAGAKTSMTVLRPGEQKTLSVTDFYRALNANGGRSATFAITREGNEITLGL